MKKLMVVMLLLVTSVAAKDQLPKQTFVIVQTGGEGRHCWLHVKTATTFLYAIRTDVMPNCYLWQVGTRRRRLPGIAKTVCAFIPSLQRWKNKRGKNEGSDV
jgi:hypothetical protein